MYHTASLVHDDVIDHADTRRKKESVNHRWLQRKSVFAGDYSVAIANKMVASLGNDEVFDFKLKSRSEFVGLKTNLALTCKFSH